MQVRTYTTTKVRWAVGGMQTMTHGTQLRLSPSLRSPVMTTETNSWPMRLPQRPIPGRWDFGNLTDVYSAAANDQRRLQLSACKQFSMLVVVALMVSLALDARCQDRSQRGLTQVAFESANQNGGCCPMVVASTPIIGKAARRWTGLVPV